MRLRAAQYALAPSRAAISQCPQQPAVVAAHQVRVHRPLLLSLPRRSAKATLVHAHNSTIFNLGTVAVLSNRNSTFRSARSITTTHRSRETVRACGQATHTALMRRLSIQLTQPHRRDRARWRTLSASITTPSRLEMDVIVLSKSLRSHWRSCTIGTRISSLTVATWSWDMRYA